MEGSFLYAVVSNTRNRNKSGYSDEGPGESPPSVHPGLHHTGIWNVYTAHVTGVIFGY